jgi:hypothetical protein
MFFIIEICFLATREILNLSSIKKPNSLISNDEKQKSLSKKFTKAKKIAIKRISTKSKRKKNEGCN